MYGAIEDISARYDLALNIASHYHGASLDKGGMLYIFHPIRVAHMVMSERRKFSNVIDTRFLAPAALLHDVIEDTDCTLDVLKRRGVDANTVEMVRLLTKKSSDKHTDYVGRIAASGNVGAVLVKWYDIADNTKRWREERLLPELRAANTKKYDHAKSLLADALTMLRDTPAQVNLRS